MRHILQWAVVRRWARVILGCACGTLFAAMLVACGGGGTTPLGISTQPADQATTVGSAATFGVQADGDGLAYQWQSSSDHGGSWTAIGGATSATYATGAATLAMNGMEYRVVVQDTAGSVTSNDATLSVTDVPVTITAEPADQTAIAGATATFSVTATGTNLTYQWASSDDGGKTFAPIGGATAARYTTPALTLQDSGQQFQVAVANSADSRTSSIATLTVTAAATGAPPTFTTQPNSISVAAPAPATFTAAASGSPAPGYQWQISTDNGSTWTDIAGATSASYTTPATSASDTGQRLRVVASNAGGHATSNVATLTVTASQPPGSGASQCIDASYVTAGYSYHAVYGDPADPSYRRTDDSKIVGTATFQGYTALELELELDESLAASGITSSTTVLKAYANYDASTGLVTEYGATQDATLVAGGITSVSSGTTVSTPPFVDASFTLAPGQTVTQTQTATGTITATINGVAQPPKTTTTTTTDKVTFVGVETITVPAGTFQACRFDHSSTTSTSSTASTSSAWSRVKDGVPLQSSNAGNITDYALSVSTSGGP